MTDLQKKLVAPFPYFGGKRLVARIVLHRFGQVANYVEPFFGSGAVLLAAGAAKVETVNDLNGFVANFWRAVKADPDAVAAHADWPLNEADLHARHHWLVTAGSDRLERVLGDPAGYDAQVAGWWAWGAGAWLGRGWCHGAGPWRWDGACWSRDGHSPAPGVMRQLPALSEGGARGVHARSMRDDLPGLMRRLSARLRHVRVAHGDWSRVCTPSVTYRNGLTAVFLDPPYGAADGGLYRHATAGVADDVRAWAAEHGGHPMMRIAVCGHEGEHDMPDGWSAYRWSRNGGFGNQGARARREVIWFSPHCLAADTPALNLVGADA